VVAEKYFLAGLRSRYWYSDEEKSLREILFFEDYNEVAAILAATSIRASISSNVTKAVKCLYQIHTQQAFTGNLPVVIKQLELFKSGEPLSGQKIENFRKALCGDPYGVAVDIWVCRAFGLKESSPSKKVYADVYGQIVQYGERVGVEPRGVQACIWDGIRRQQGGARVRTLSSYMRPKVVTTFLDQDKPLYTEKFIYINPNKIA
jgi:hypothetical protein